MDENARVQYTFLQVGVHRFVWLENTPEATESYLNQYNTIVQNAKPKADDTPITLRFLLDLRDATLPPLDEMVAVSVEQRRRMLVSGNQVISHFAYLSDDQNLHDKINRVEPLMPPTNRRKVFTTDQEDEAIDWLVSLKS